MKLVASLVKMVGYWTMPQMIWRESGWPYIGKGMSKEGLSNVSWVNFRKLGI